MTASELICHVIGYYRKTFEQKPEAREYLSSRKCFDTEAANLFQLGYSDRSLGLTLPSKDKAEGKAIRKQLQEIGLYRNTGHEHFRGTVLFPIHNLNGEIVQIYGRRISKPVRNAPDHLLLTEEQAGVWNYKALSASKEWILCSSIIDALTLWVYGYRNVTATLGATELNPDFLELIETAKPERITLCIKNSESGADSIGPIIKQLEPYGIQLSRVELKPDWDINSMIRRKIEPQPVIDKLIASAVPLNKCVGAIEDNSGNPDSQSDIGNELQISEDGKEATIHLDSRSYRLRGLNKNSSFDVLKVNVRIKSEEVFHFDTFDLYQARGRKSFIATASDITGLDKAMIEADLNYIIGLVEPYQDERIKNKMLVSEPIPEMTEQDEREAMALLKEKDIFARILGDFERVGVVGERLNKLLGYLIAVSRKLDRPLSGQIVARSAAGKSSLMNSILDFVPPEDKQVMTALTAQALFYMPENGLKHKVLAVAEDEGSTQATYPLKILGSENQLTLAVTVRDKDGGLPQTKIRTIKAAVAQLTTSTKSELDYELGNRYLILTVDESPEQTKRIHDMQREGETISGVMRRLEKEKVLRTHHNAQRLLKPVFVHNPFTDELTFPHDQLRLRRDNPKYLGLIRTIAFLRQYQKQVKTFDHGGEKHRFIEVDQIDIDLANSLANEALGRSLDEIAPPTRSFLKELDRMVSGIQETEGIERNAVRFTRKDIRESTKWSVTQVREHLNKLVDMELVHVHRLNGYSGRHCYELAYQGEGDGVRENGYAIVGSCRMNVGDSADKGNHSIAAA